MTTRLKPIYIANVLLFINDSCPVRNLPLVSKNCHNAMQMLKVNPVQSQWRPNDIITFFPNINTMAVRDLSCFEGADALPDSVTSIVVECVDFRTVTDGSLHFADRVVEIRGCYTDDKHPADFTLFPNLKKATTSGSLETLILPRHRLTLLRLHCGRWDNDPSDIPPECAEQIIIVYASRETFLKAKARQLPPNVRVFCSSIGEGVAPEDVYLWPLWRTNTITLSPAFGMDELRAFNEKFRLPYRDIVMQFETACAECDISFLTHLKGLSIKGLQKCALRLPTSVEDLELDDNTTQVTVSSAETLTRLQGATESITILSCPMLAMLQWCGETLSEKALRFPISDMTTLFDLDVDVDTIDPDFRFPRWLTSLSLEVSDGSVDVAQLMQLTDLEDLTICIDMDEDPLDLSGLTTVTALFVSESPILRFPTSLVTLSISPQDDFDFSPLTNLTWLGVWMRPDVSVTFPTGLKALSFNEGFLNNTNIGDVALEWFELGSSAGYPLKQFDLERQPKTLKTIKGLFSPESLEERLSEFFPLLGQKTSWDSF